MYHNTDSSATGAPGISGNNDGYQHSQVTDPGKRSDSAPSRRRRKHTKCPDEIWDMYVSNPNSPITRKDISILLILASYSYLMPSGQRSLAFPSQATIARRLKSSARTVSRSIKRIKDAGLMTVYLARMAGGRKEGGEFGHNYYDLYPYFRLAGENILPHNQTSIQKYIGTDNRWHRGRKQDERGSYETTIMSDGAEDPMPQKHDGMGGQDCRTNETSYGVGIVNQTKFKGKKQANSVDNLPPDKQIVYWKLVNLRYSHFKALSDLKKYPAPHVEARIDYVTHDAKDVDSVPRLINYWMERPLQDAYVLKQKLQEKQAKPKSEKEEAEPAPKQAKPQPTPVTSQTPAAQAIEHPAITQPTKLEMTSALRGKLQAVDPNALVLARARAALNSNLAAAKFDVPIGQMSWQYLYAIDIEYTRIDTDAHVRRKEQQQRDE